MTDTQVTQDKLHIDEKLVIDNLETLKVLTDPLRLRILQSMGENPHTVKQISKGLGIPPNKLYYHVNMLEEHGLIRVVETRVVSGIIEKIYLAAARSYMPARDLLSPGVTDHESNVTMILDGIFEETKQTMLAAFRAGLVTLDDELEADEQLLRTNLASLNVRLTPQQAQEISRRLTEIIDEVGRMNEEQSGDEGQQRYRLLFIYFPMIGLGPDEEEVPPEAD